MSTGELSAVCIRCGNAKRYAPERCPRCGFAPSSNADLAKSFILSAAFDVGDGTIGRSADELSRIAAAISSGKPYEFSEPEVAAAGTQVAAFRALGPRNLLVSLIKWLGPPILITAIVYLLLWGTWGCRQAPKTRIVEAGIVWAGLPVGSRAGTVAAPDPAPPPTLRGSLIPL